MDRWFDHFKLEEPKKLRIFEKEIEYAKMRSEAAAGHGGTLYRHLRFSLSTLFFLNLCIAVFMSVRLLNPTMIKGIAVHGFLYRHWRSSLAVLFLLNIGFAAFVSARLLYFTPTGSGSICSSKSILAGVTLGPWKRSTHRNADQIEYSLTCSPTSVNTTPTCPVRNNPKQDSEEQVDDGDREQPSCPDYFRWIHEDLSPWRETGITLDMVEAAAKKKVHFRLTIVNGTPYVETYRTAFVENRETFTQWGILQLLRLHPGKIPDLDLVFYCGDRPSVAKEFYPKPRAAAPPPLFGYDGDDFTLDIPFPDWSFWGWPEIIIKPWEFLSKELEEGNERSRWVDRDTHAYWKGNHKMSQSRKELLNCNVSQNQDWNALIYAQDWNRESKQGFKNSNLADQCNHRYKIYIEGVGWSVSQKYILACDSVTLLVKPRYYDFFTRSLVPLQHYWPIRDDDKCRSIKYAVDWGNTHQQEAQAMGKAGSSHVQEGLQMKYIYAYMFHLLTAYGKLMRYKPSVPPNAVQLCPESLACKAEGLTKKYLTDSAVKAPADTPPCAIPPPYDPPTLRSFIGKKENSIKQVESWEKLYWDAQNATKSN